MEGEGEAVLSQGAEDPHLGVRRETGKAQSRQGGWEGVEEAPAGGTF